MEPVGAREVERATRPLALAPLPANAPPSVLQRRLAELSGELATMRRVVIAQKAELDFEREEHARSRLAARKAIDVAQRAIAERRTAIKLARRERRARLELEGRLANRDGETTRRNAASAAGTGQGNRRRGGANPSSEVRRADAVSVAED